LPTGIMTGDMTGSARNKDFMETIRTRKRIKAGTKTGTTNRIKVTKKITSMATCVPATMATNIMAGHHDRASMAPHMATARIIIMHRPPLCLQD